MIRQRIHLDKYDWVVYVYYAVDCYYTDEIIDRMAEIDCDEDMLRQAYEGMSECKLNTGVTYSNFGRHTSVMVIALTSSPSEFQNSFDHEKGHLCKHIVQAMGINPFGEEAEYLAGDIGQKLFPVAKQFLCEHCRREL